MNMSEAESIQDPDAKRKPLPRWLVVPVILSSAAATVAAMSMTGMRGPALAWDRANRSIEAGWFGAPSDPNAEVMPGAPAGPARTVAGAPGVPMIVSGAALTHMDRGVCTSCHAVVSAQGTPVPAIHSMSVLTHEYRGVCGNCHLFRVAPTFGGATAVAGTPVAPRPQPAGPSEAEWQGLEVAPGATGVVVQSAEGKAGRVGLQTGDLVTSINGAQVKTMTDFVRVTENGTLAQGAVIVRRNEQRLAFELTVSTPNPQPAAGGRWGGATNPVVLPPPNAQF